MTACNGSESFALQVLGSSMEPEFPADCIIVVEPTGVVEDGCFVVAEQRDEVILRQLKRHGVSWTLHALEMAIRLSRWMIYQPCGAGSSIAPGANGTRENPIFSSAVVVSPLLNCRPYQNGANHFQLPLPRPPRASAHPAFAVST